MNRFTSERFNSGESLVNFSHLEKIQTLKKFCSGEYLSHLQKIQFFRRFDCGHLLNISQRFRHSKDSTTRKYNFKFRTEFEYNLYTSLHFTPLHFTPLCLPHFKPLCATSLLPFCLPHFVTPSVIFASFHLTSRNFTSPILSASLHATTLCLLFFFHHFTSLCHFASPPLPFPASLHATSRHLRFFLTRFTLFHATSLHLPFCPPSLHSTSRHFVSPTVFSSLASPHLTPLYFTSRFDCLTSIHFMPLRFA